jgi:carboxypeptidase Taq
MSAYQALEKHYGRLGRLGAVQSLVGWDTATTMPPGSAEARGEETAALGLVIHDLATDPRLGAWFADAERLNLDSWQAANLREMKREWLHATAVPGDLVEALSIASSRCEMAWRAARPANDFKGLLPLLAEVLTLTQHVAAAKADAFGCDPYDALLDQYEPGGRAADIDRIFAEVGAELPALIQQTLDHQASRDAPIALPGPFSIAAQEALGRQLMTVIGFDFSRGRLDVSSHPFCGGTPDDIRLTTRYREDDFRSAMMGVLHETGHALYEVGLPADWRYQPVGCARGMSIHESQSLLMEMQACRSRAFVTFAAPLIRAAFNGQGPAWERENLYRLGTRVTRGLIRVDADEVTYPAHVILRYRLERALVSGALPISDLPGAWNDGMQELLGVRPPSDVDGCLQDIHWPSGAFGYFPTYTLGAMTAAQLYQAAGVAIPDLDARLERGDFSALLGWLRAHVHGKAASLSAPDLLIAATGRPLESAPFLAHLRRRYLD